MFFLPQNQEVKNIFERLTRHPVTEVNSKLAQTISRHKKIRYLSHNKNIFIRKGMIGLPEQVKIKKKGNGFEFFFP